MGVSNEKRRSLGTRRADFCTYPSERVWRSVKGQTDFSKRSVGEEVATMTITDAVVADYVAGRLDGSDARVVEAEAARDEAVAVQVWLARDHARRARSRLREALAPTILQ